MYTPYNSRHFTTYIDPISHIKMAVLTSRVAPIQQGFYFVNSSWSDDGRYFWFYCAFPPAAGHTVAVIDFLTDEIHHFPETIAEHATWMVDPRNGDLYWGCSEGVYCRTPHPEDKPVLIAKMPQEYYNAGAKYIGTHLNFTPDYKEIVADMYTPFGSRIGSFDVFTGAYKEWYRTDSGVFYNHAQVNPVNGNVCMCAHEGSRDLKTGQMVSPAMVDGVYPRLQIINRDGECRMIPPLDNYATHEFWAADGKSIYYCNENPHDGEEKGAAVIQDNLDGSEPQIVCRVNIPGGNGAWHAHCTKDEKYFVIDGSLPSMGRKWWRGCESTVHFYNRKTNKMLRFLTKNPIVEGWTPDNQSIYHIDPHPRFVLDDTMITLTTTVRGYVDVALVAVEQLIEATE